MLSFKFNVALLALFHYPLGFDMHLEAIVGLAASFTDTYDLNQICIMLCADHGPCVSGAHNTIVTARAGKDLVSSLVSGTLWP
jgi:citrate synthase